MFGGKLFTNYIQPLSNKNCLLAIFSNQLYVFDLNESQILKKIQLCQNLVKEWRFFENQNKIVVVQQNGNLIEGIFNQNNKSSENWYQNISISNKKVTKNQIIDAKIIVKNQFEQVYSLYFIQQNALYEYQNGVKNVISKNVNRILFASENNIICDNLIKPNTIKIFNFGDNQSKQGQIIYEHSCPITASLINENNLIIGDVKGKIYVLKNYLISQNINKALSTKLEWHVHQVNSLFLDQEYLYSCGEQGTVVMWHLRQNKRDFLPRIGTQILNAFAIEGIVYCLLKDNSITAIDLSNDKLLKHYKTLINPFGFLTKNIKEKSFSGKRITTLTSSTNNRNLLATSALPGSFQIIDMNDGSNHDIEVLPRNLISRLDEYYPEPHDTYDISFNKDWTLMCCSTFGINHNYLHFYKNQGYNLDYNLISKVQNPHEGPIKILSFNNTFITFSENQKTLRFWSKVRRVKKSIVQKEQQYFTCSGQINYRQKQIQNCSILNDQNLLLINYKDQVVLIDLKKRQIQMAFKSKVTVKRTYLTKKNKNTFSLILISSSKISAFQLSRTQKVLRNSKIIYQFEKQEATSIDFSQTLSGHAAFLIKYLSKEIIIEYDINRQILLQSFENENPQEVSILSISYLNQKLLSLGSDSSLTNLTNSEDILKLSRKHTHLIQNMETQQDSGSHFEKQTFQQTHANYIERQNVRKKGEIGQCLEKIELQMYPNLGFSFSAFCQKMFI